MFPTEYVMVILHYMKFLMLNITSVNGPHQTDIWQEEKTMAGAPWTVNNKPADNGDSIGDNNNIDMKCLNEYTTTITLSARPVSMWNVDNCLAPGLAEREPSLQSAQLESSSVSISRVTVSPTQRVLRMFPVTKTEISYVFFPPLAWYVSSPRPRPSVVVADKAGINPQFSPPTWAQYSQSVTSAGIKLFVDQSSNL